jgi:hypothetical protein
MDDKREKVETRVPNKAILVDKKDTKSMLGLRKSDRTRKSVIRPRTKQVIHSTRIVVGTCHL